MHEFRAWPKTPRLFREITVTEKIDGTNAAIHITPVDYADGETPFTSVYGETYEISAQSRKRIITPESDNFGFARWVHDNAPKLVSLLGPGLHYGEWWGHGIQRGYGLDKGTRRFSLFNTERHEDTNDDVGGVDVQPVPVLYKGPFSQSAVEFHMRSLRQDGSVAAPGFDNPEGVCVFHTASRNVYKVTLDNNDAGKWEA